MNRISKEIGTLMKEGKKDEAEAAKEKTYSLKEEIKSLTDKLIPIDIELKSEIITLLTCPMNQLQKVMEPMIMLK